MKTHNLEEDCIRLIKILHIVRSRLSICTNSNRTVKAVYDYIGREVPDEKKYKRIGGSTIVSEAVKKARKECGY